MHSIFYKKKNVTLTITVALIFAIVFVSLNKTHEIESWYFKATISLLILSLVCIANWLWDLKIPDREKIQGNLKLNKFYEYIPPKKTPPPTVDASTRYQLERLCLKIKSLNRDNRLNLGQETYQLLLETLKNLTKEVSKEVHFPISNLHGFAASKSCICNNFYLGSQPTMAEFGSMLTFPDYKNLDQDMIIHKCLMWQESDLNRNIKIFTDNWHKRYYWNNHGGSHHMGFLCYQLQTQNKEWCPLVTLTEYQLDMDSLNLLEGKLSIFVCMHSNEVRHSIFDFETMYKLGINNISSRLGVHITPMKIRTSILKNEYQLIIIDHSKEFHDFSLNQVNWLVTNGFAACFKDFLKALMDHGTPKNDIYNNENRLHLPYPYDFDK